MTVTRTFLLLLITLALVAACGPARQKIPVSTDPIGATVYADGERVGESPTAVRFDRSQEHLVTIVKEGYEQEEIIIRRRFKPNKAIRDGVISGILKGGDPQDVAGETAREVDEQERSGEAYELVPAIITIKLTPTTEAQ